MWMMVMRTVFQVAAAVTAGADPVVIMIKVIMGA